MFAGPLNRSKTKAITNTVFQPRKYTKDKPKMKCFTRQSSSLWRWDMGHRFEDISFFSPSGKFRHYEATFLAEGGGGGGLIPCERGWGCKDRRVLGLSFIYPIPGVSEDLLPPKSLSKIPTFPSCFYIVCLFTHSPSDNIGKTTFLPLAPLNKSRPFPHPPPGGGEVPSTTF